MPVVTIQLLAGRTKDQKSEIAKAITDALVNIGGAPPQGVHVIFDDVEKDHWANAGTLIADR